MTDFIDRVDTADGLQVIAFRIGGELHACDILMVQEVVSRPTIHRLPDVPPHLLGVLRLRGDLLPVLDVAATLGLALAGPPSAVLIAEIGDQCVGVAVDAVHEVVIVPPGAFRPAPSTGSARDEYVVGVARVDGVLLNLVDLERIVKESA
jgi:purine-binding chemotaxis protein CheW